MFTAEPVQSPPGHCRKQCSETFTAFGPQAHTSPRLLSPFMGSSRMVGKAAPPGKGARRAPRQEALCIRLTSTTSKRPVLPARAPSSCTVSIDFVTPTVQKAWARYHMSTNPRCALLGLRLHPQSLECTEGQIAARSRGWPTRSTGTYGEECSPGSLGSCSPSQGDWALELPGM